MRPRIPALVFVGLIGIASCGSSTPETTPKGVSLAILEPANRTTVKGNTLTLRLRATGIDIVKADGDTSGKTGHYHVFIDEIPVAPGALIPKTAKIVHSADDVVTLTGLTQGTFGITVVLGDGAHTRLGNVKAALEEISVEGPAVKAAAPSAVSAGKPFTLNANVQGVSLVPADGDTSRKTGHLHVFIDRDPTPAGQAIPKGDPAIIHVKATLDASQSGKDLEIALPALTAGDHVIWIVLGDGAHVPWAPSVLHKITVTVS